MLSSFPLKLLFGILALSGAMSPRNKPQCHVIYTLQYDSVFLIMFLCMYVGAECLWVIVC